MSAPLYVVRQVTRDLRGIMLDVRAVSTQMADPQRAVTFGKQWSALYPEVDVEVIAVRDRKHRLTVEPVWTSRGR